MTMRCANPECGDNTIVAEIGENMSVSRRCAKCGTPWRATVAAVQLQPEPQQPAKPVAKKATSPLSGLDVIKAARARLRELNAEISRLKKLTAERDRLERLLTAAKTPNGTKAAIPLRRCAT